MESSLTYYNNGAAQKVNAQSLEHVLQHLFDIVNLSWIWKISSQTNSRLEATAMFLGAPGIFFSNDSTRQIPQSWRLKVADRARRA